MSIRILLCCGLLSAACATSADQAASAQKLLAQDPMNRDFLETFKRQAMQVEDANEQSRYLVTYFFGLLSHKQYKSAADTRRIIVQHHPDSPHLSKMVFEKLMKRCRDCREGKQLFKCKTCNGENACRTCSGKGRIRLGLTGKVRTCPDCQGQRKCSHCDKDGKQQKTCPTCRGTNKVFDEAQIKRTYLKMLSSE